MTSSMTLHAGNVETTRDDVYAVPTPAPEGRHYPVNHGRLIRSVVGQLVEDGGYNLAKETHSLGYDGARYFGVFDLTHPSTDSSEYGFSVGIRNSHDKSVASGLVLGTRVWVCENLSWSGEVKVSRKHTRFISRDLDSLVTRALGTLGDHRERTETRIAAYKGAEINDMRAHDLIVRAIYAKALPPMQLSGVVNEWRNPSHEAFEPRTMWSLFNAFTEVYKTSSQATVCTRSQSLHGLFDSQLGLAI